MRRKPLKRLEETINKPWHTQRQNTFQSRPFLGHLRPLSPPRPCSLSCKPPSFLCRTTASELSTYSFHLSNSSPQTATVIIWGCAWNTVIPCWKASSGGFFLTLPQPCFTPAPLTADWSLTQDAYPPDHLLTCPPLQWNLGSVTASEKPSLTILSKPAASHTLCPLLPLPISSGYFSPLDVILQSSLFIVGGPF